MKYFEQLIKTQIPKGKIHNGFGLTEALVALISGTIIISAGAIALKSTGSLINQATNIAVLRQNKNNGIRLLRSEVERSLHLIINTNSNQTPTKNEFRLNSSRYKNLISHCKTKADGGTFLPIFGIKMASTELLEPVLYGYGLTPTNTNYTLDDDGTPIPIKNSYSLLRCGAPMDKLGGYIENKEGERNEFVAIIVDNIGSKNCSQNDITCRDLEKKNKYDKLKLSDILNSMAGEGTSEEGILFSDSIDNSIGGIVTPIVTYRQPALRIQTDKTLKLIKFIAPNPEDKDITYSYLQTMKNGLSRSISPLYLAAFARADKRHGKYGSEEGMQPPTIFQDITSKNVRFILDGSGSMSACIIWSDEYGEDRKFWRPGYGYIWTDQICLLTRMETLIQELHTMVNGLEKDTYLALEMFSASGGKNHDNQWIPGGNLARIGDQGNRNSALDWIVTLDDVSNVGKWGGTEPWPAINRAFKDTKADTVYFLSDGVPNNFYNRDFSYGVNTAEEVVTYYTDLNNNRAKNGDPKLQIHTIALGLESEWMKSFSQSNNGDYMQYDSSTLSEVK